MLRGCPLSRLGLRPVIAWGCRPLRQTGSGRAIWRRARHFPLARAELAWSRHHRLRCDRWSRELSPNGSDAKDHPPYFAKRSTRAGEGNSAASAARASSYGPCPAWDYRGTRRASILESLSESRVIERIVSGVNNNSVYENW